jgi:transposase-like protein
MDCVIGGFWDHVIGSARNELLLGLYDQTGHIQYVSSVGIDAWQKQRVDVLRPKKTRAAYLMTTDQRGISALLLQRQLGLQRYETAWMMLHKLRRAMINLEREPLRGEVEVDETWIGGTQAGLRGSRQLKGRKAALALVAVEKRGRVTGRTRMAVIRDFKRATLLAFLKENVALGSTVYTGGLKTSAGLQEGGFQHVPRPQPLRIDLRKGANSVLPLADRAG